MFQVPDILFFFVLGSWYFDICIPGSWNFDICVLGSWYFYIGVPVFWYFNVCISGYWYFDICISGSWYFDICVPGSWYFYSCVEGSLYIYIYVLGSWWKPNRHLPRFISSIFPCIWGHCSYLPLPGKFSFRNTVCPTYYNNWERNNNNRHWLLKTDKCWERSYGQRLSSLIFENVFATNS